MPLTNQQKEKISIEIIEIVVAAFDNKGNDSFSRYNELINAID